MSLLLPKPENQFGDEESLLLYLILHVNLSVGEVGDRHLVARGLPDLVLRSFVGPAGVQKVSQGLVVNFNEAGSEGELMKRKRLSIK